MKKAIIIVLITAVALGVSMPIAKSQGLLSRGNAAQYSVSQTEALENSPIKGKRILFLGSSVTYGSASKGESFADFLAKLTGGSKLAGFILILAVSIFISGFVDNVPYIIVMLPVAGNMAESMGINRELFLFALLIGSCLGGNLTPFGASANVVAMGIVKKEGHPMSFAKWLKLGGTFTLITTAAAAIVLWLLWA